MEKRLSVEEQDLLKRLQDPIEVKAAVEKQILINKMGNYDDKSESISIDNPVKTVMLVTSLIEILPFEVKIPQKGRKTISKFADGVVIKETETVTEVSHYGDLGGIVCCLEGNDERDEPIWVSLTQLRMPLNSPLRKKVEAYQKHRIKKLKRDGGFVGRGLI